MLHVAVVAVLAVAACSGDSGRDPIDSAATTPTTESTTTPAQSPLRDRPLPAPVTVRQQPRAVTLADPVFEPLPGAQADFGTVGGAAYQIEIPADWNGRLVLWMHGFQELASEAAVSPPDFRRYLIANGYAWAASSFSSTSLVPGLAADETAALWDHFVTEHERPRWTYVAGVSMGGWSAHIAAERYADRFDGALGLCGAVGTTPGLRISAEVFVAAAHVAGVSQAEFDTATSISDLIDERIRPALGDPAAHARFEDLVIAMTGGPRAFARQGVHLEEETNLRRARIALSARAVPPRDGPYELAAGAGITSAELERDAIRLPADSAVLGTIAAGTEVTGDLQMPLVTLHTTGDGQVPIDQARILLQRVEAAGRADRLVQRVIEDPGHCGFSTGEQEAALEALVGWVEHGRRPAGTNLDVADLSNLDRTFELVPRPDAPGVVDLPGASGRAVVRGRARLDGTDLTARWIGARVRHEGLVTPCQISLPPIEAGGYEIGVFGQDESAGCGAPGAEILFWTHTGEQMLFATTVIPWPTAGTATADIDFSTSAPQGAALATTDLSGEVYRADGERIAPGTRVEAYVGDTLCGVASIRSGSFVGYILSVVGPDSKAGCRAGATITFRVDGAPVVETVINSPDESTHLDLTLR